MKATVPLHSVSQSLAAVHCLRCGYMARHINPISLLQCYHIPLFIYLSAPLLHPLARKGIYRLSRTRSSLLKHCTMRGAADGLFFLSSSFLKKPSSCSWTYVATICVPLTGSIYTPPRFFQSTQTVSCVSTPSLHRTTSARCAPRVYVPFSFRRPLCVLMPPLRLPVFTTLHYH